MCKTFREIKATLLSPCCLSEQPAMGNEVETLDYIPGSALRGILAEAYLQNGGEANNDFRQLFCEDIICFPNLYPRKGQMQARPIPLSIYTCKSQPGFINEEMEAWESNPHGVWNLLFEDSQGYTGFPARRCHNDEPDGCGHAPLKHHTGFYTGHAQPVSKLQTKKNIATRTAIAFQTQSALEASLHSQSELPAGAEFWGLLTATDENAVKELEEGFPVTGYTGRRRMGKIEISMQPPSISTPQSDFLNFPVENGFVFFALTLLSDTILVDKFLRPAITLTPEILKDKQQVGFPGVNVSIIKAFCATRQVSGWHSVARIFKPDDIALVKGSTFLMKVSEDNKADVQNWMGDVLYSGIGLRCSEGFGQVCFDEPLHKIAAQEKGGAL